MVNHLASSSTHIPKSSNSRGGNMESRHTPLGAQNREQKLKDARAWSIKEKPILLPESPLLD